MADKGEGETKEELQLVTLTFALLNHCLQLVAGCWLPGAGISNLNVERWELEVRCCLQGSWKLGSLVTRHTSLFSG